MQAIQTATVNAAEVLGIAGEVGALQSRTVVDVIAVGGDPLKRISILEDVEFVMKSGRIVKQ
jgi:imidazolonepropionase-like amidohydrolase